MPTYDTQDAILCIISGNALPAGKRRGIRQAGMRNPTDIQP
ncbi:hypothetical protein [Bacteroides muris (ex Fokt et al. 2023)]|nr:hypothetical protein [Bacteroides muris (ex Fokt et al. 2023)]